MLLTNLAVATLLAGLVWLVAETSHGAYMRQARDNAEDLAAIAQANVASELRRVESLMHAATDELEALHARGRLDDAEIARVLDARRRLLPGAEGLRMADAKGLVRWGNGLRAGAPVDVSDRSYFIQARTQSDDSMAAAGPFRSRVSGHWVIGLAQPMRLGGQFSGLLYASVQTDYFRQLFATYDVEGQDVVTLRMGDMQLIARHSPGSSAQPDIGSTLTSQTLKDELARNRERGTVVSKTAFDNVERTTAYRAVDGWPLIVFAGLDNERYFAPWRAQVRQVALLALFAWLLFASATVAVYRAARRENRSLRALSAEAQRMQSLLRVAGDGIHVMDSGGRLIGMSDSFAAMLGATREELLGRHISSWDAHQDETKVNAWLARLKDGDRQRVEVCHRHSDGHLIDVELQISVAQIGRELIIYASARDITERKRLLASLEASSARVERLMQEQSAMLDNDIVGMVKIKDRHATWHNRALASLFGYEARELEGAPTRLLYPDDASYERVGSEGYPLLNDGRHYRTQLQMRHKNGHLLWIDLSGVRLDGDVTLWTMADIGAVKDAQARAEHIAFHDALTGLPNRLLLADRLRQALATQSRTNTRLAVCYLDLDGFKRVNDECGHDAGDALLAEIGRRLARALRRDDTAARVGGDEFVVLLTLLDPAEDTEWRAVVERLIDSLQQPITLPGGKEVQVGASVGVALAPQHGTDRTVLLALADQAMLKAKRAGKGRMETASPG
ncbi:bifunctional diguanylate cyclase/phosphodiesterase [Roseateles agri]|uniref:bifunctional diguanylate cyclase/phosphodiesterase n=1 Tax=Roseateles agri TaxID=3098619 RepID=UPI002A5A8B61|nr:diguanylate cyclase [Paucibacter sp. R3-3]